MWSKMFVVYDFLADLEDFLKIHDMHVVLGILSTYFYSPFLISLQASSPGKKAVGRKMKEKLATYVQFPCLSPSTELSTFRQSARSGNKRECKQTFQNTFQG